MERCFRPTGNPLLVARCERLKRAIARLKQKPTLGDELRDTLDLGPPAGDGSVRPAPRSSGMHELARSDRASAPPGRNRS